MSKASKKPAKGRFLLAEPFLKDPNFNRTVVFLTEHNDDGSIGFILNRPIDYSINELMPDFPQFEAQVFLGGPVQQDSLHFIHRIPELAEEATEVLPGIYWGGSFEVLKALVIAGKVDPNDIRFFVGYSGWGANQLEQELESKSWIISYGKDQFTFAEAEDADNLWKVILESMGTKYKVISNYPPDPSLN